MTLPAELAGLADAFSGFLFETHSLDRTSHHVAHVASENWFAAELAYLFNTRANEFGLPGWSALVERKRVDVTLIPPSARPGQDLPCEAVYLELKLVDTGYWNTAWREVRHDLTQSSPAKPTASYSVCVLSNAVSSPPRPRRKTTVEKYRRYMERVPLTNGCFEPTLTEPPLYLAHTSPQYLVGWKGSVFDRWPDGYEAETRVLWVSRCPA